MKETRFKKGDWVFFCEFELKQIKETEESRITSVSNGSVSHGSYDLSDRCYPLEMTIKVISDEVEYFSRKFHSLKNNALNHPDLNRALVDRWVIMCENKNNEDQLKTLFKELSTFCNAILKGVEEISHTEIEGIKIFR